MEGIDLARKLVEAALDKQASNIALLDVRKICSYTDYIILCNAESTPQLAAILKDMEGISKKEEFRPRIEGDSDSGWILLDLGEIVVHVLSPTEREYYKLDELWNEAQTLVKIQ